MVNVQKEKIMNTRVLLLGLAYTCAAAIPAGACTGIALTAKDGSYIQARTIEWVRLDTRELRCVLDPVPLSDYEVLKWIEESLGEQYDELN